MGTVYLRGRTWWIGYRDAAGKWIYESADTREEREARRRLAKIEAAVAKQEHVAASPKTLAAYAAVWSKEREGRVWTAKNEMGRLKKHVLPELGALDLAEIRPRHVRALVKALRVGNAPRSVRNIYGVLHRLFEDAVAEELVDSSPCSLMSGDMPAIADKNPKWREGAEFSRDEVQQLISDQRIPANRRMWWAMGFLAGMRGGEIAALRWCDYDPRAEPLGKLVLTGSYNVEHGEVKATKTGRTRDVPVHPTLAAMLAEWKLSGWASIVGRPPKDDDLLVTSETGGVLADSSTKKTRPRDLKKLGLRVRRFHDARSTFITLGTVDGGEEVWLERVTHNAKGSQFNQYRRTSWPKLCQAVACLRIERLSPAVLQSLLQRAQETVQPSETTQADNSALGGTRKLRVRGEENVTGDIDADSALPGHAEEQPTVADCRNVVSPTRERLRLLMARYAAGSR